MMFEQTFIYSNYCHNNLVIFIDLSFTSANVDGEVGVGDTGYMGHPQFFSVNIQHTFQTGCDISFKYKRKLMVTHVKTHF